MDTPIKITVLGCRGTIPVSGDAYRRYGGATCCILVQYDSRAVVLDAGTGLLDLPRHLHGEDSLSLLLTHPHLDHIMGLPMFPLAFQKDFPIDIYGATRNGLDVQMQVTSLMAPPLWPVGPQQLPAAIRFHPLDAHLDLHGIAVDCFEGAHPGGVSVLRLTIGKRRIILLTDCTISDANRAELTAFCRDCDLLLCDGQYSDEEWPVRSTFGHNSWNAAAHFARACGAKCTRILHHDPTHTDGILDAARSQVGAICPACDLARNGEEITL